MGTIEDVAGDTPVLHLISHGMPSMSLISTAFTVCQPGAKLIYFFLPAPTPPFLPVFAALAPGLPLVGGSFRFVPGSAGLIVKNESRRPVNCRPQQHYC
jgi:hypothetical protein